jgi:DNA-binding NarL/FixJ family response regulator
MSLTIFLADDHGMVREGLRLLLETQPDFKVIGEAGDGREAVHKIVQACPDIAILDIAMPELNGLEATWQIHERCPGTQVIILSMYSSSGHIARALQAGARGYVLKSSVGAELVDAIRTVGAGQRYLSQKVSNNIIDDYLKQIEASDIESPLVRLSPREREILQLVVEGKSSVQIAGILSLSASTVDTYRSRLMQKLELEDLPSLVKFAIQHGLTPLE